MCPDLSNARIKNEYSDFVSRVSTNVEISECNPDSGIICESEEKIRILLDNIYFTMYTLHETVQLGDEKNYKSRPTKVKDTFL